MSVLLCKPSATFNPVNSVKIIHFTPPGRQQGLDRNTRGSPPARVSGVCHTAPDIEPGRGHPRRSPPGQAAAGSPACQLDSGLTNCCKQRIIPDIRQKWAEAKKKYIYIYH